MVRLHEAIAGLMEDRQAQPAREADAPVLSQFLTLLGDRTSGTERPLVEAFARELFGKATDLLLAAEDVTPFVNLTLEAFRFLYHRGTRQIAARVAAGQVGPGEVPRTVVESILDDRPFIVDTMSELIRKEGGEVRLFLHPLLGVERNEQGALLRVTPPEEASSHESFNHAEVVFPGPRPDLLRTVESHLEHVLRVTDDYRPMRESLGGAIHALRAAPLPTPWNERLDEATAFLEWLGEKSFVYLGFQEYEIDAEGALRRGNGLGILRVEAEGGYDEEVASAAGLREHFRAPFIVRLRKTEKESPVHRLVPMDDIGIAKLASDGSIVGAWRLLGLFTSKASFEPAEDVPILRELLAEIVAREGVVEESHDYKDLVALFDTIPIEQLLASDVDDVQSLLREIGSAQAEGIRLVVHPDARNEHLFITVLLPRTRFSTQLSERVTALLRSHFKASILHQHLALDERPRARLHYCLATPPAVREAPPVEIAERDLNDLLRTWDDELHTQLARVHSPGLVDRLTAKYRDAFPASYKASVPVEKAVRDIECLEALARTGEAQIEIITDGAGARAELKLYLINEALVLSEFVPVLENLALRVFGEEFVDLQQSELGKVRIHTYFVAPTEPTLDLAAAAPALVEALHALRAGRIANDRLNALVLRAGLEWRAIDVLRTYVEHAGQVGVASRATLVDALVHNPSPAVRLHRMFATKFDPAAVPIEPERRLDGPFAEAERELLASLNEVESLPEDRILRTLAAAVRATVRTNFYRQGMEEPERDAIAIKIDGTRLEHLPEPHPLYETYVHGPFVEGIHMRGGRVARGGVRLSDRCDDFRSEVWGLMRTQVIKNAVIVPVGAKGGFVVKRDAAGGTDVERAYRAFVGALLSITDNMDRGRFVPPFGQLVYDPPDPYLVVAADKGTAAFSDVANEVAARYKFWLGDAFASGGAHGYDHKKLGITARGAWECARQHFREMGRDIDREPLTVVGIGDMSGDVFGNGMLRSRTIRLLAAFDHRSVFLDPEPDADRSYWERERLFHLPTSSWEDYSQACLGPGGAVFRRSAKSVTLSPQAQAMLGVRSETLSGEDLVRAVLRLKADMLWNGGIGTYVKASNETHAQVGDSANDRVRVDATELRVQVVVEGGNLGVTQRGRIEFALAGGRINTDAIDNSGGVDCSDHEVNLKIALQPAIAAGESSVDERNRLLASVADEVCEAVLEHNRRQALALSLDQVRSRTMIAEFRDLMAMLEAEGALDRAREQLPSREALRERRSVYRGLTRPELAVLLAHAKLDLQHRVLDSPLSEDHQLESYLRAYFPAAVNERFPHAVREHPLRQEITAVEVANRIVDAMGMTFVARCVRDTGRDAAEIVKAWTAATLVTAAEESFRRLAASRARLSADAEQGCTFVLERALEAATKWMLETQGARASLKELVDTFREPVAELLADWPANLTAVPLEAFRGEVERLRGLGVEPAFAEELARLAAAADALEITEIARQLDVPTRIVADAYFRALELVDLEWLRRTLASSVSGEARWERRAIVGLIEGLMYARRQLTINLLAAADGDASIGERLRLYTEQNEFQLGRLRAVVDDLRTASQPTLAGMLVAMRELGRLTRAPERAPRSH